MSISVWRVSMYSRTRRAGDLAGARAKVSLRLALGDDASRASATLARHLRANAPWGIQVNIVTDSMGQPLAADLRGTAFDAARRAYREAYGHDIAEIGGGRSIPFVAEFARAFPAAEILVTSAGTDAASSAHAIDESSISATSSTPAWRRPFPRRVRPSLTETAARADHDRWISHLLEEYVSQEQHYAIHYEPLFSTLETMDVQALIENVTDPWYNQTLIQVGGVLVRLGVMQGEFHWHKHDEQDEFFFVLEGLFRIELEGGETAELGRRQAFSVPAGMLHRPVVPVRSAVLMLEKAGVIATGN